MKTRRTDGFNTVFNGLKGLAGFPLRFPVCFEKFKLGTISIDYESRPFTKLSAGKLKPRKIAQISALPEIISAAIFLKNDIELACKLKTRYLASKNSLSNLIFSYDYENEMGTRPREQLYYIFGDDIVLDFIRAEGPLALRVISVMFVLHRWLDDPKRAGMRLDKLINALMEYMRGKGKDEIRFPDGRPPSEAVELIGKKIIKEFYEDLTAFLKLARKKKGQEQYNEKEDMGELKKLIEESTLDYIALLESSCRLRPDDLKTTNRLRRILHMYEKKRDQKKAYTIVFDCLNYDPELLAEFNIRSSKPNYIAKEIVGRLLGVSSDTVTNVLYRKNRKKETEAV